METLLQLAFGLLVLFLLYKFHVIQKLPLRIFFRHVFTAKKLRLTYRYFSGGYHHNFMLEKGKTYTLYYNVQVTQGTMRIHIQDVLETIFLENEAGTMTITTSRAIQSIFVEGKGTQGNCHVEWKEAS